MSLTATVCVNPDILMHSVFEDNMIVVVCDDIAAYSHGDNLCFVVDFDHYHSMTLTLTELNLMWLRVVFFLFLVYLKLAIHKMLRHRHWIAVIGHFDTP